MRSMAAAMETLADALIALSLTCESARQAVSNAMADIGYSPFPQGIDANAMWSGYR